MFCYETCSQFYFASHVDVLFYNFLLHPNNSGALVNSTKSKQQTKAALYAATEIVVNGSWV